MTRLTLAPTVPSLVRVDRFGVEVDGMPFPWLVERGSVSASVKDGTARVTVTFLAGRVVVEGDEDAAPHP